MSKPNSSEIILLLNALAKDIGDMKVAMTMLREENTSAAAGAEVMFKTLNSKFDMFKNLESEAREALKPAAPLRMSRPQFFKRLFQDEQEREKYMNVLYTQEEIDDASDLDDVKSKKKDVDRMAKIAAILYASLELKNRKGTFESIFTQAKFQ